MKDRFFLGFLMGFALAFGGMVMFMGFVVEYQKMITPS